MAQYRLQRSQEAEVTLVKAAEKLRNKPCQSWADNLIAQLLLREAQALIDRKSTE